MSLEKVVRLNLDAQAGNGAVAHGAYTQLVTANHLRRWITIKCPASEADDMLIVLPYDAGLTTGYGQIHLDPGESFTFSTEFGTPWQGVIFATGVSAASYCYWTEVSDRLERGTG